MRAGVGGTPGFFHQWNLFDGNLPEASFGQSHPGCALSPREETFSELIQKSCTPVTMSRSSVKSCQLSLIR